MAAPLPEERVSKIGQFIVLRCTEPYEALKAGVLRLERLFDLRDAASFQENTHLLLLGHHVQLLAAKMRRLQIYLLSGEVISLRDSWNTMRSMPQDPHWERVGHFAAVDENVYAAISPVKRYIDIFEKSVRAINEHEMFVNMAAPPDILPTNTKDAINFVVTKFAQCARFFSSVQVFLILKHFAATFPPALSTELKSLRSMAEQGFLSEAEYSDRRLLLFDKHVPPRQRTTTTTTTATQPKQAPAAKAKSQSGDEALAEVTRMLEESMRRTTDRRSVSPEMAAALFSTTEIGVATHAHTPPPMKPAIKSPNPGVPPDSYRRKTVNFDQLNNNNATISAPATKAQPKFRHASSYATSTPSSSPSPAPSSSAYPLATASPSTPAVSTAYSTSVRAVSSAPATPAAASEPSKPAATPVLPSPRSLPPPPPPPGGADSSSSSSTTTTTTTTTNTNATSNNTNNVLKQYHNAIYAPVEPEPMRTQTPPAKVVHSAGTGPAKATPPLRPSSTYVASSTASPQGSLSKASAPVYTPPSYEIPEESRRRTEHDVQMDIAARRRYYAQLDRQREQEQQQQQLSHQPSMPALSRPLPKPGASITAPPLNASQPVKVAPLPASALPPPRPPAKDYDANVDLNELLRPAETQQRKVYDDPASQVAMQALARVREAQSVDLRQTSSLGSLSSANLNNDGTFGAYPLVPSYSAVIAPARPPARPPPRDQTAGYNASLREREPTFHNPRNPERTAKARTLEYKSPPVMLEPLPATPATGDGVVPVANGVRHYTTDDVPDKPRREKEKKEKKEHKARKDKEGKEKSSHKHKDKERDKEKEKDKKAKKSTRKDKTPKSAPQQ